MLRPGSLAFNINWRALFFTLRFKDLIFYDFMKSHTHLLGHPQSSSFDVVQNYRHVCRRTDLLQQHLLSYTNTAKLATKNNKVLFLEKQITAIIPALKQKNDNIYLEYNFVDIACRYFLYLKYNYYIYNYYLNLHLWLLSWERFDVSCGTLLSIVNFFGNLVDPRWFCKFISSTIVSSFSCFVYFPTSGTTFTLKILNKVLNSFEIFKHLS